MRERPCSPPTAEWYYCSVHRTSHCIRRIVRDRSRKVLYASPIDGECAWLFFPPHEIVLLVQDDVPDRKEAGDSGSEDDNDGEDRDAVLSNLFDALTLSDDRASNTRSASAGSGASRRARSQSVPSNFSPSLPPTESVGPVSPVDGLQGGREAELNDASTGGTIIHVPIRRNRLVNIDDPREVSAIMGALVPADTDESVMSSIRRAGASRGQAGAGVRTEFFAYTDVFGERAAQPTAHNKKDVRRYFQPLDDLEEGFPCPAVAGAANYKVCFRWHGKNEAKPKTMAIDPVLRQAREWSCWAQGFAALPDEVRWALALVFDFANVMIVRQAQELLEGEEQEEDEEDEEDGDSTRYGGDIEDAEKTVEARLRYENFLLETRHHLEGLLFAVEHVADLFGVREVVEVPDLDELESSARAAYREDGYQASGGSESDSETDALDHGHDVMDDCPCYLSDLSE